MTNRSGTDPSFVREQTDKQVRAYSHVNSKADQKATRESHRGTPANEESDVVTTTFEPKNLFLSALPAAEQLRLRPYLAYHRLTQGLVLQEPEERVEHVYFIESGMISLVALMQDGWTAKTRDRSLSAQYEHSIGITETGVVIFTLSPTGLHTPHTAGAEPG